MRIAVTGAAGFIGAKVVTELLDRGHEVVAIDNFDTTYSAELKHERISRLEQREGFRLITGDIRDERDVRQMFDPRPDAVVHLAAQGGLRKSMDEPAAFISANISGFGNVIKATVDSGVGTMVYASSGAVYGGTPGLPFREEDAAAFPLSLYGATKRCDELLAFTYAHGAGLRCTGLRFSTVYGTDGRPDMAMYTFARRINEGQPIQVHGHGKMVRDFVWGDDVARAVVLAVEDTTEFGTTPAAGGPRTEVASAPWRVLNVATGRQVELMEMIRLVEAAVSKQAELVLIDALAAEVRENRMDVSLLGETLGFVPAVQVEEGIPQAVRWYLDYLAQLAG
ncbi:MAG TPA: NAD-dependent epimerase/dehydratase family protein [Propionibacteriaceae bacterium]|nr:NAD-dependent epimerase/dehydratase family protein [Propionibacteriaceae bacterium]